MYKLAIIIPVYKVLPFILACVDSIQKQYSPEIQYIFVDDGCPENSLDVAAEHFQEFFAGDNVHIIKQKNNGLSAARNAALDFIDSLYFTFIDSDDIILDGYVRILLAALESSTNDIVQFNFNEFDDICPSTINKHMLVSYSGDMKTVRDSIFGEADWYCWRRVFSTKKYGGIRFIEGIILEDILYCADALIEDCKILLLDNQLYGYRNNPQGLSKTILNEGDELHIKWVQSFEVIYQHMSSDPRFDHRISDWVDVLAVKFSPSIFIHRASHEQWKTNYFSRCYHALRHAKGGKRIRRLFMLTWPKGYFILAKAGYAYLYWNACAQKTATNSLTKFK